MLTGSLTRGSTATGSTRKPAWIRNARSAAGGSSGLIRRSSRGRSSSSASPRPWAGKPINNPSRAIAGRRRLMSLSLDGAGAAQRDVEIADGGNEHRQQGEPIDADTEQESGEQLASPEADDAVK